MHHDEQRNEQQAEQDETHGETLEPPALAGAGGSYHDPHRNEHSPDLGQSKVLEPQIDPDELGDDRQGIEQEEVDDAESAPELAKTLEDQPRVADAGHRAQPYHHLLLDVEHRAQQH